MAKTIGIYWVVFLWMGILGSSAAQENPNEETWYVYAVESTARTNMNPVFRTQQEAVNEFFRIRWNSLHLRCIRYYYNTTWDDNFIDLKANHNTGQWEGCDAGLNPGTSQIRSIAPGIICTKNDYDNRCFTFRTKASPKNVGKPSCGQPICGNPISVAVGNKYQVETDFEVPSSPWLTLKRFYNSSPRTGYRAFGARWTHSLDYSLSKSPSDGTINLFRPDGSVRSFLADLTAEPDEVGTLQEQYDADGLAVGWAFSDGQEQVETYDRAGRVLRIDFFRGGFIEFTYPGISKIPQEVVDHFGRKVTFTYNRNNEIIAITAPSGAVYSYGYEQYYSRLSSVTKPGGVVKRYLYDNGNLNWYFSTGFLTGIVDEDGVRYATYSYDNRYRAISSEHAGGALKTTVSYAANGNSVVTLPTGAVKTFVNSEFSGKVVSTESSTTCADGSCGQSSRSTFDARGNLTSSVSETGEKTCYAYEPWRNLLVREVSGLAPQENCQSALQSPPVSARTITISWHADFRKPVAIAEPLKIVLITYDDHVRVASVSETATSDTSGADGLDAMLAGAARATSLRYNEFGQLVEVQGPRSGASEAYEYDTAGNLISYLNAEGQRTTYGDFDGDGRPGSMTKPSGLQVTFSYSVRGELTAMTEGGETTALAFRPTGLLSSATTPAGAVMTYGYDQAHRLTSVTDDRGNKISMTLNAAGQATATSIAAPGNAAVISTTRVFDALGRLRKVTGAQDF